jgi:hypothetical protein
MTGVYTNLAKKRVEQSKTAIVASQPTLNHSTQPLSKMSGEPVKPAVTNHQVPPTPPSTVVHERPRRERSVKWSTDAANIRQQQTQVAKGTRPYAPRTFNIFADQIEYLNRASLEQRLAGRDISINDMVREAIDLYIAQNAAKK